MPWTINPKYGISNDYAFATFFYGQLLYDRSIDLPLSLYADDWVIIWTGQKTLNISYANRDQYYAFSENGVVNPPPKPFLLEVDANMSVPIVAVYSNTGGPASYNYTFDVAHLSTVSIYLRI